MKKLFLSMFVAFITFFSLTTISTLANAHWYHDGYGYVSNVCRAGGMWQVVPYDYIGLLSSFKIQRVTVETTITPLE